MAINNSEKQQAVRWAEEATEREHNDDDINITVTLPKHTNMKKNGTKTAQNDATNNDKSDRSNKIKKHWKTLQMEGDEDWVQAHIDEHGLLDDCAEDTKPSRSHNNKDARKNKNKSNDNKECIDKCRSLDDCNDDAAPSRSFNDKNACKNKTKSNDNGEKKRDRIFTASKGDKHWSCSGCAGTNAHGFIQCWKCRKEKRLLKRAVMEDKDNKNNKNCNDDDETDVTAKLPKHDGVARSKKRKKNKKTKTKKVRQDHYSECSESDYSNASIEEMKRHKEKQERESQRCLADIGLDDV